MSAEIVNLRRVRKAKLRAGQEEAAAANRATYGLSKAAREVARADRDRMAHRLDAHRLREAGDDDGPAP